MAYIEKRMWEGRGPEAGGKRLEGKGRGQRPLACGLSSLTAGLQPGLRDQGYMCMGPWSKPATQTSLASQPASSQLT